MRKSPFLRDGHAGSDVGALMNAIQVRETNGTFGAAGGVGALVAATESYATDEGMQNIADQLNANYGHLQALVDGEYGSALESWLGNGGHVNSTKEVDWVKEHQRKVALQLGSYALEAARDPKTYMENVQAALESAQNVTGEGAHYFANYTNGERASATGIGLNYAQEAFENNNLATAMSMSVTYNLAAAIQDPAIELLFKTIVMSPEEVTFFYEVAVDRFWNGKLHDTKAKVEKNFHKTMLMDAIRRPRILHQDVLNVVPFLQEAGEGQNDDMFMPKTTMAPQVRRVANVDILTNPLKVGVEYDLLQISQHPGLANGGIFDETDTLDSHLALENIYLSINTDSDDDGVIKLPLAGLERRNFLKSLQGHGFDMELNFQTTEVTLTKDTLDTQGRLPPKLKTITDAGYALRVQVKAIGQANVETGFYHIALAEAKVVGAVKITKGKDGQRDIIEQVDIEKDTAVAAHIKTLNLGVKYFDPYANRTNANIRTLGILLDRDVYTAKYAIGIRSPVRYQRKIGVKESEQSILESLIRFSRLRQNADGWYELFRYRDTLKMYQNNELRDNTRIPDFIGVGKYMVKPYYRHLEININDVVKSVESKNNLDNVREYLVAVMQEVGAEAVIASQWMIAAAQQNGGSAVQPHFGIVCGQYLPLVLSLRGDLRLMGENFGHTIKTTQNDQMDEKIFMTLVNPDTDKVDGLSFGNCFTYPEVVVSVSPHSVNGAVRETFIVQPRYQHIAHLPILVEIDVIGLKEFIHTYNLVKVDLSQSKELLAGNPGAVGIGGAGGPGTGAGP